MGEEEKERFLQRKRSEVKSRYRQKQVRRKWGFCGKTEMLKQAGTGKAQVRKKWRFCKRIAMIKERKTGK
jgi:hypothetical protein